MLWKVRKGKRRRGFVPEGTMVRGGKQKFGKSPRTYPLTRLTGKNPAKKNRKFEKCTLKIHRDDPTKRGPSTGNRDKPTPERAKKNLLQTSDRGPNNERGLTDRTENFTTIARGKQTGSLRKQSREDKKLEEKS